MRLKNNIYLKTAPNLPLQKWTPADGVFSVGVGGSKVSQGGYDVGGGGKLNNLHA